jgi:hypothetical protein
MHSITAWSDYFTTTNPNNPNSQTYTSTQTPSATSVYVSNCVFRSITSTSNGSALSCTSISYLLVESTSFFSCKTSGQHGGAIYFYNSGGQCVLHEVCGYDCYSTHTNSISNGQFAYILVNNGISSKNIVDYSSIVRCVNEKSGSYYILCLFRGKNYCLSVNISMNKCQCYSGVYNQLSYDLNYVTCSLSYSSIADNNATANTCIYLWNPCSKSEIKSCNIIRNTQIFSSWGTIAICTEVVIEDCCILENKANYIFFKACYSGCIINVTITNCTIDSTSNNLNLTIQNTVTKSFIHALNHMNNLICYAEYDVVGTLTPITPPPSSFKKQRQCTCMKIFYQCQLSDFISLHRIFIFNIILPDASEYHL